ncbi:EF-hand domain pair [Phytophthora cinnamomi]|uniref:EF-hand domain pair n=1 Tax=Phytophthora cinnamomi TaxID=4785 RepID=UPI0035597664|nr:EF-hand domain pair [Phytophthora cinnamomi]
MPTQQMLFARAAEPGSWRQDSPAWAASDSSSPRRVTFAAPSPVVLRSRQQAANRDNEKRIGVNQILQGLRLLGLPATHNQISDYVYLIHEGRHNTIDLEEWEILVGTLDAASRPSNSSPRILHGSDTPSRSPSLRSTQGATSLPSRMSPRSMHSSASPCRSPPLPEDPPYKTVLETNVAAEHQAMRDDDPYLEEIQNRIEGMFERAQATAALRWAPDAGNNQLENYSRSDCILKRAATVVYSLRASLFPLVHQAEVTLREIQQRHGSKLSLFLPPGDMAAIAQNSDVLAAAILDDILLDTVQLLNDEDKQQSYLQLEARHADQLGDILARIQDIERQEDSMIQQGLALTCAAPRTKCDLPTAALHGDPSCKLTRPVQNNGDNLHNLTLPLQVVMNIDIADRDSSPHRNSIDAADMAIQHIDFDRIELPSQFANNSVRTSILEGRRLQFIERRRHKFQHHRRVVEASLAETGMAQSAVIEILEEMLLDDLIEQTAAELNDSVLSMSDTLLINLL